MPFSMTGSNLHTEISLPNPQRCGKHITEDIYQLNLSPG